MVDFPATDFKERVSDYTLIQQFLEYCGFAEKKKLFFFMLLLVMKQVFNTGFLLLTAAVLFKLSSS